MARNVEPLIAAFEHGWWRQACTALGVDAPTLPVAWHESGNAYAADLESRIDQGNRIAPLLRGHPSDLLIDNGGTGLSFLLGSAGPDDLTLTHEACEVRLCSHFIDPLVTAFQGLDWGIVWQCLQSPSWIKAVWDRAQAVELQRFGVPSVLNLPMAAPDREYHTDPLDPDLCRPVVSFIGGQNTIYFDVNASVATRDQFAGVLAHAVQSDLHDMTFHDIYHDLYRLGEPISASEPVESQIEKTVAYFAAKLYYNAALCIRNRDRFVVFLKRAMGESFELVGRRWDSVYGLDTQPPIPTSDAYFNRFREVAINLNLVNGNAETALNMRHFEITAAGGFLMCYDQPDLSRHFEVGKECVAFSDERDLLDKVRYYLERPRERVEIALAGQRRTLRENLYSHRLQSVLNAVSRGGDEPRLSSEAESRRAARAGCAPPDAGIPAEARV